MNYSLEKISTVQACDTLLAQAQRKKQGLERKRRNLGETIDVFRRQMDKIDRETEITRLLLDAFTAAFATMPEGKDKMSMIIKVKRLEIAQVVLQKKALRYHVNALLDREIKYMILDNQVLVMEQYILAVETWEATLSQPILSVSLVPAVSSSVAEASAKTVDVTPDLTAWRTVIDTFLNTTEVTPVTAALRVADRIDDQLELRVDLG